MDIERLKKELMEIPAEQRMKLLCEIGSNTCGDMMPEMMKKAGSKMQGMMDMMKTQMCPPDSSSGDRNTGEPLTLNITENINMVFSWIPAGGFMMGSSEKEQGHEAEESPRHKVRFDQGFYMGRSTVTASQWNEVMEPKCDGDDEPAVMISWHQAVAFAGKLTEIINGLKFDLPTEAQWEYACRAGSNTRFSDGDTEQSLAESAWYAANSEGHTHPAGEKTPNKWNLYDMHGNVFEWCRDWEGRYSEGEQTYPAGPEIGQKKILRGGCFKCPPQYCRCANRYSALPDHKNANIGFRLIAAKKTG